MEVFKEEQFSTCHLGHLGLVAAKIDSMDLIGLIDRRLPVSELHGAKVTHGERVAAMILNGLGFIDSRLYLFPEFLSDKPLDRLFTRKVQAEWFNDDATGRCLDEIAAYGPTKLFTELSIIIGQARGLLGKSTHIDTTTLSLFGDYEHPTSEGIIKQGETTSPWPEQGYAKSGRHDLKQMVLLLATTGAANFPVWMESHSGNASDQTTMPAAAAKIRLLCQGLADAPDFLYVGDSAIYANILQHSKELFWVTRVPERIKEASELVSTQGEIAWIKLDNGYAYHTTTSDYKGVKQRWLMFYSEAAHRRESNTFDKKIKKESIEQDKAWWHLSNRVFTCRDDAHNQAEAQKKQLKYHGVTISIIEVKKHDSKGRPKSGELPEVVGYKIEYTLSLNEQEISRIRASKGRFILATNQLDETILSNEEILREYKGQSGTERGFKFIKDDTFQVDSVFLKTPERIDALMMVMTLCLMVYGVSEYELHQSLQATNETIPSQTNKPTNQPSLRWVYFLFRVVNELNVTTGDHIQKLIVNLNGVLRRIIKHFGPRASAIYLNPA
jgi:transposase